MTKQDGIRLVTELEAERILLARGFTKEPCKACNETGAVELKSSDDALPRSPWIRLCDHCQGAGWTWKEPAPAGYNCAPVLNP